MFRLLMITLSTVLVTFCFASEEPSSVKPIQKIEVSELNFEDLPEESKIGNLSELVKEDTLLENLTDRIKFFLHPHSESLAYVNGQLCHIGNYPQSIIYTVLEGPYYGTQTTTDYIGNVLYVNYDYVIKYTSGGVVLHHHYSDSKVITGSNQIVKFY